MFRRAVQYGLANYPEKSKEEQWLRFCEHMQAKYSEDGYIRLWLPNSPNEEQLRLLRNTIADPKLLRVEFDRYYQEEAGTTDY